MMCNGDHQWAATISLFSSPISSVLAGRYFMFEVAEETASESNERRLLGPATAVQIEEYIARNGQQLLRVEELFLIAGG
ncbi:hypothetical protein [Rhizobium aegyptiacum]|uniref:hypothetical protein n=1 Tax=Rhizobium aegyptiacum TaxID=1764550 RepID=UPI00142D890C|nr:hypothetical protein [Rhizobium aegyptiacum]